jgi:UDP-N-acetylmuramate--alanine ligase
MELGKTKRVHIVGIGGAGMSAIAELLLKSGFGVTGSDLSSGEVTDKLAELGAIIYSGHRAEQVASCDVVVYSSAIRPEQNIEIITASNAGIPVIKRDEMLGELMRYKSGICIAGTHGKTTTTAMIATMLIESGESPTVMIGGISDYLKGSTVVGEGKFMVIEADEYDRAFLKLTPTIAVVNSLESEHMDTYGTLDELKQAFVAFANKVPFYGRVICCVDWPEIRNIIPLMNRLYTTFGIDEPADVMASDIVLEKQHTCFSIQAYGQEYRDVCINVPGRHNVLNALAAFSTGLELGIMPERLIAGLGRYSGDYAHHPSEVKATVRAAKSGWLDSKVIAIFQPHLFSRTSEFAHEYGWALSRADIVFVASVYPAREKAVDYPGVDGDLVAAAVRKAGGKQVEFIADMESLFSALTALSVNGNMLLFMGAGDITHLATRVADFCRQGDPVQRDEDSGRLSIAVL